MSKNWDTSLEGPSLQQSLSGYLTVGNYNQFSFQLLLLVKRARGGSNRVWDSMVAERLSALLVALYERRESSVSLPISDTAGIIISIGFESGQAWWSIDRYGNLELFEFWWSLQEFSMAKQYFTIRAMPAYSEPTISVSNPPFLSVSTFWLLWSAFMGLMSLVLVILLHHPIIVVITTLGLYALGGFIAHRTFWKS